MTYEIKLRRTTRAIASASTEVLKYGEPIAVNNGDGTTDLIVGDGVTMLKDLNKIGNPKYSYSELTKVKIGGVSAGSSLENKSLERILYEVFSEYQSASLTSLSHNKGTLEVGYPISGNIQFTPVSTNTSNIASATISSTPTIFSSQSVDATGVFTVAGNGYTRTNVGSSTVTLSATGGLGESSSAQTSVKWQGRIYFGTSAENEIYTKANVTSLASSVLRDTAAGDYYITSSGYIYICIPNAMGIPVLENLKDKDTGLTYDFIRRGDIVFSNGYIDLTYKIFRSTYYRNGTSIVQIV